MKRKWKCNACCTLGCVVKVKDNHEPQRCLCIGDNSVDDSNWVEVKKLDKETKAKIDEIFKKEKKEVDFVAMAEEQKNKFIIDTLNGLDKPKTVKRWLFVDSCQYVSQYLMTDKEAEESGAWLFKLTWSETEFISEKKNKETV
jgi:hypothetical protein